MSQIKGILTAINSKRDKNGNTYWAMRYVDTKTGKCIEATISGGESNIYAILRYTGKSDDWDRSILFQKQELGIREFNNLTKSWSHAGCNPEELANFIKKSLE